MRFPTLLATTLLTLSDVTLAVRDDIATSIYNPRCLFDEKIRCCEYLDFDDRRQRKALVEAGKDPNLAGIWDSALCVNGRTVDNYDSCNSGEVLACCYHRDELPVIGGYRAFSGKTSIGCFPAYFGLYLPNARGPGKIEALASPAPSTPEPTLEPAIIPVQDSALAPVVDPAEVPFISVEMVVHRQTLIPIKS